MQLAKTAVVGFFQGSISILILAYTVAVETFSMLQILIPTLSRAHFKYTVHGTMGIVDFLLQGTLNMLYD